MSLLHEHEKDYIKTRDNIRFFPSESSSVGREEGIVERRRVWNSKIEAAVEALLGEGGSEDSKIEAATEKYLIKPSVRKTPSGRYRLEWR